MLDKDSSARSITFRETLAVWVKIGLLSFGGPTGQIALMHRELVEKRRWISDSRFSTRAQLLHALARAGSAATGNLYRLAAPTHAGGHHRRLTFLTCLSH